MCVCDSVWVHALIMCAHVHMCASYHVCTCAYVCIHVSLYVSTCDNVCECVCLYMCVCVQVSLGTRLPLGMGVWYRDYVQVYMSMHIHECDYVLQAGLHDIVPSYLQEFAVAAL